MTIRLVFGILTIALTVGAAQDRIADSLRKGVVEEESKHNLDAAIQNYQAALSQFDEVRQTAATALFRMAECYRKQGKQAPAVAAYKRVALEFADQRKLAEQSRSILAGTYHAPADEEPSSRARGQAREVYRNTLVAEVALVERELGRLQNLVDLGSVGPEILDRGRIDLLKAQRQLAAFDAGISQGMPAPVKRE